MEALHEKLLILYFTPDQLQKIHRNAQAISILTSSIDKEKIQWFRWFGCGQGCLDNTLDGP
jgi:hypothetical protein